MLDINYYRQQEELAKNSTVNWLTSASYSLDVFEKAGFPVRLNNIQQLRQIMDSMHEGRFDSFMAETGGVSDNELEILVNACCECIRFQQVFFPKRQSVLPLSSLMAQFLVFMKLTGINKGAKRILEIGPGVGFFSFFLKHFENLEEYTYSDACESFYMLQNYINAFVFKENFNQEVINHKDSRLFISAEAAKPIYINAPESKAAHCNAYPWWKLGALNDNASYYDYIVSNANLLEFSEGALDDYLGIFKNKLTSDGMVFSQCLGDSKLRNVDYLFSKLHKHQYAVLFLASGSVNYPCANTGQIINKNFRLPNLILIREGHPLFNDYYPRQQIVSQSSSDVASISCTFFPNNHTLANRKIYTKEQIKTLVQQGFEC